MNDSKLLQRIAHIKQLIDETIEDLISAENYSLLNEAYLGNIKANLDDFQEAIKSKKLKGTFF